MGGFSGNVPPEQAGGVGLVHRPGSWTTPHGPLGCDDTTHAPPLPTSETQPNSCANVRIDRACRKILVVVGLCDLKEVLLGPMIAHACESAEVVQHARVGLGVLLLTDHAFLEVRTICGVSGIAGETAPMEI